MLLLGLGLVHPAKPFMPIFLRKESDSPPPDENCPKLQCNLLALGRLESWAVRISNDGTRPRATNSPATTKAS